MRLPQSTPSAQGSHVTLPIALRSSEKAGDASASAATRRRPQRADNVRREPSAQPARSATSRLSCASALSKREGAKTRAWQRQAASLSTHRERSRRCLKRAPQNCAFDEASCPFEGVDFSIDHPKKSENYETRHEGRSAAGTDRASRDQRLRWCTLYRFHFGTSRTLRAGERIAHEVGARPFGDRIMSTLGLIRRSAAATCGAFVLLAAVAWQNALAQSGASICDIRVDVGPLRVNAGDPTSLVGAAGTSGSTCQSYGGSHDGEWRHAGRADRLCRAWANQGQLVFGQHWRRRDDRGRTAARAGYNKTSVFADRPGDDRTIQSLPCDATRASAHVLAGQTPLNPLAVDLTVHRGQQTHPSTQEAEDVTEPGPGGLRANLFALGAYKSAIALTKRKSKR